MRDEVLNHEIWVSFGGKDGKGRGTVASKKTLVRKLTRMFAEPSVDNSVNYAQYMALPQDARGAKKAAPGFIILGKFKDGRRKITHQIGRSGIQIDIDYATPEQADYILNGGAAIRQYAFLWHTTRAHCAKKPRVRIILPTDRMVDADEANALTRLLALQLADDPEEAIEIPDLVSFRYNQIMYLPSISKGQDYQHGANDAPVLAVDDFLAQHIDWQDIASLPRQEAEKSARAQNGKSRMEDPTQKDGLIGAFCRSYSVEEAIETFIPDVYTLGDCSTETRYTYNYGSASNGAVVYDDGLFLHSHHGTDPAEGCHNAWDLVRLHLFAELDEDAREGTTPGNMPSFKAMCDLALKDERVLKERAAALAFDDDEFDDLDDEDPEESSQEACEPESKASGLAPDISDLLDDSPSVDDLLDMGDDDPDPAPASPRSSKKKPKAKKNRNWQAELVLDKADQVEKSKYNAVLIVTNDRRIAPTIALNELSGGPSALAPLRFPEVGAPQARVDDSVTGRKWTDADTAALAYCLSAPKAKKGYGRDFTNQDLQQAMLLAAEQNRYNPVLNKIALTKWDGVRRVETFFIDWLGAADNAYHRELAAYWFLAGIARLYEPGHKFDLVPILGGRQGGGKSGLIEALGMGFFGHLSGEFSNTQKMVESTRGKWILEVPELKGFHRGLIEDIKLYFAATFDTVRLAYRTNEEDFARRCIYMGSTNEGEYLRDEENRRFCPVLTNTSRTNKIRFDKLLPLIPQLWAEAEVMYHEARKAQPTGWLPLDFQSAEAQAEAIRLQTEARETAVHEPVAEVIRAWLDAPVSAAAIEADDATVDEFDNDGDDRMFVRNLVTATMIRIALAQNPIIRDLKMSPDKVIGQALRSLDEWDFLGSVRRMGTKAKFFARMGQDDTQPYVPVEKVFGRMEPDDDLLG